MKKIYLSLLALGAVASADAQQMAPRRDHTKLLDRNQAQQAPVLHKGDQGSEKAASVALGNASNMYTTLLSGPSQVAYNPELNSILFVHRHLPSEFSNQGGTGTIRFDVSTDGGATFTTGRLLTPTLYNNTNPQFVGGRYPSIAIHNPVGNTDPANAYAVSSGLLLNDYTASQVGLIQTSSAKFDGSNVTDAYVDIYGDTTTYHTYGLQSTPDGTLWSVATRGTTTSDNADSVDFSDLSVLKGVFNTGTNSVDWTVAYDVPWDVYIYDDPTYGTSGQVNSWNIGFSPDGQTGYVVINGVSANTTPRPAPQPYVFKTTDGGASWAALPVHDFSAEQWVIDNIPGANDTQLPRPYFSDMDMVVDANGKMHMISEVLSQSLGNSPDSVNYVFTALESQFIVHAATTDGVTWELATLGAVYGEDYQWPAPADDGPYQSNRTQASRTADGTKVFFSWNSSGPNETENILPDMYAAGLNVTSGLWTAAKNLTLGTNAEGAAWWHTVANISITGGADHDYEIPTVYAEPGAIDTDPCGFWYLKGVGFDDAEFAFSIGISENPLDDKVSVFPNPTSGPVNVMLNGLGTVQLTVMDVTGRIVTAERTNDLQHTIDLSTQPAGVYTIMVSSTDGRTSRRIVKQ